MKIMKLDKRKILFLVNKLIVLNVLFMIKHNLILKIIKTKKRYYSVGQFLIRLFYLIIIKHLVIYFTNIFIQCLDTTKLKKE